MASASSAVYAGHPTSKKVVALPRKTRRWRQGLSVFDDVLQHTASDRQVSAAIWKQGSFGRCMHGWTFFKLQTDPGINSAVFWLHVHSLANLWFADGFHWPVGASVFGGRNSSKLGHLQGLRHEGHEAFVAFVFQGQLPSTL